MVKEKQREDTYNKTREKTGLHVKSDIIDKQMNAFLDEVRLIQVEQEDLTGSIKEFVTPQQVFSIYQKHFGKSGLVISTIHYRIKVTHKKLKYPDDLLCFDDETTGKTKFFINRLSNSLMKDLFLPQDDPVPKGIDQRISDLDNFFRKSNTINFDNDDFEEDFY